MTDRSAPRRPAAKSAGPASRWWTSRWTVGVLVLVLALVFVLENRQPVSIRLWIPVVVMPQWAALTIMLILGGAIGALLARRPR